MDALYKSTFTLLYFLNSGENEIHKSVVGRSSVVHKIMNVYQ